MKINRRIEEMKFWKIDIDDKCLIHADNYDGTDYTLCGLGWEDAKLYKEIEGKSKSQLTCPRCLNIINGILSNFKGR
jgi:hypothetical protein